MKTRLIRPDVLATLLRWREAAIGAGAAGLGAWWALTGLGLVRWLGVALILGGIAIIREGLSRARRPEDGGGTGLVEVDERQIAYFTAAGGETVSIEALRRVALETGPAGHVWHLQGPDGTLTIPGAAAGAGALFDALAALPGFDPDRAATLAAKRAGGTVTLWQAGTGALSSRPTLH